MEYENITFPLSFQVFKPKRTLKPSDKYKTKIELAEEIITELIDYGFQSDNGGNFWVREVEDS